MKENNIKFLDENGKENTAEVLLYFRLNSNNNNYILYTLGEVDNQHMETIHASVLVNSEGGYRLENIDDADWDNVKEIMRKIIRNEEG